MMISVVKRKPPRFVSSDAWLFDSTSWSNIVSSLYTGAKQGQGLRSFDDKTQTPSCNHCPSNDSTCEAVSHSSLGSEASFIKCGAKGTLPAMQNDAPQPSVFRKHQRKKADTEI